MFLTDNINKIRKLLLDIDSANYDASWMSSNPNKAFLISLGAGPWKYMRRYYVQRYALEWYKQKNVSDLIDIDKNLNDNVFPFKWQNDFLNCMISSLKTKNISFYEQCLIWKKINREWEDIELTLLELFKMCGTNKKGTKVLWMFARDFLDIPAFPIDRHIKRALLSYKLPIDSWEIVKTCFHMGVNSQDLNRCLFGADGINPDWSNES